MELDSDDDMTLVLLILLIYLYLQDSCRTTRTLYVVLINAKQNKLPLQTIINYYRPLQTSRTHKPAVMVSIISLQGIRQLVCVFFRGVYVSPFIT